MVSASEEQEAQNKLMAEIIQQLEKTNTALLNKQNKSFYQGEKLYKLLQCSFTSLQQELVDLNTSSNVTNEKLKLVIVHIEDLTKPNSHLILSLADIGSKLNTMSAGVLPICSLIPASSAITLVKLRVQSC